MLSNVNDMYVRAGIGGDKDGPARTRIELRTSYFSITEVVKINFINIQFLEKRPSS